MKILTVLGARPQFVKAAAVSRQVADYPEIQEIIVHTGQHFDHKMSDIFFEEMAIPRPDYNLKINSLSHGAMTGRMLEGIEEVIMKEKPDYVLVYGDTNSTIAGALAAKKLHVKVAHVEAGLRSFNMVMPEEVNRILTDRISDWLFCPTETAVSNLKKEGFQSYDVQILNVGDVMYDAALYYARQSAQKSTISKKITGDFVLVTLHRAENTDNEKKLASIFKALNKIAQEVDVVLPIHPRTRKLIEKFGIKPDFDFIDPVGYFDMLELLKNCRQVLTDSGGLQKEAYFFEKKCITMREQTEWSELLESGMNILTGSDADKINEAFQIMKNKKPDFSRSFYGNGNASKKIIKALMA